MVTKEPGKGGPRPASPGCGLPGPANFQVRFLPGPCKGSPAMFSLQRLLGKEDMFFELLEASAREAHNSVQSLVRLGTTLDSPAALEEFARARRKDKEITA